MRHTDKSGEVLLNDIMNKTLTLIIKILIGATFFVPLLLLPQHFIFPFIVPKILAFRTLALLMFGAWILSMYAHPQRMYGYFKHPVNIALALYVFSLTISTFFGVDWYKSFWDNHERMLGLFTIVHYVLFYVVASTILTKWNDWKWLFRVFLLAGSVVMCIGIVQRFIEPEYLLNRSSDRVSATLGNAIYMGAYGMFMLFVSAILFIKERELPWRIYLVITALLGLTGMMISGTRGVFVGFMASLAALLVSYVFSLREHKKIQKTLGIIIVCCVAVLIGLFVFRKTNVVSSIPTIGRLVNTDIANSVGTRLIAWEIAYDAFKERPVFGWGPNNFFYAFNKYYNPESLRYGFSETWFDNAHNATVNVIAVQGMFGLLAYLATFVVPIFMLWHAFRAGRLDPHTTSLGTAFLVAHYIQQLFVFENPTSYLYLFFFYAFVYYASHEKKPRTEPPRHIPVWLTVGVGVFALLVIYSTNIQAARANNASLNALRGVYQGKEPVAFFLHAVSIPSPHIDDIRADFARAVGEGRNNFINSGRADEYQALLAVALNELEKNFRLHPRDIRIHMQVTLLSQIAAEMAQNEQFLFQAEKVMEEGLSFSPKRQQLAYTLAGIKYQLGKVDEAILILEETINNEPRISESWWRLAIIYGHAGRDQEARNVVAKALEQGVAFDKDGMSVIAPYLPATTTGTEQPSE
jgi:O-antigen ligase